MATSVAYRVLPLTVRFANGSSVGSNLSVLNAALPVWGVTHLGQGICVPESAFMFGGNDPWTLSGALISTLDCRGTASE